MHFAVALFVLVMTFVPGTAWAQSSGKARPTLIRLQVVQLADDDGSRQARVTTEEMHAWIRFANKAFDVAGIRLAYLGNRSDTVFLRNTVLNRMDPSDWNGTFREACGQADRVAARYPGKLVVFIRWGAGPNPTGGANGGGDWDFVVMGAFQAMNHCGHPHFDAFAHELGHHFGLGHTFSSTFPTREAAEKYLFDRGNKPEAFDGDGFTDTPPDPSIGPLECDPTRAISLNGLRFILPRRNLMSYYDERDSLTPQQVQRVRWMLRKRLENKLAMPKNRCPAPIEAESLKVSDVRNASTVVQEMTGFGMVGRVHGWSGNTQLFIGAEPGGTVTLTFPVPAARNGALNVYLTQTPDFGIGQFKLDGKALGGPVDCYAPMVMPSGRISLGRVELSKGEHRLSVTVVGKNELSTKYSYGIDCLELSDAP
jgi:Pregnancy-associated plasma protein-A